MAIRSSYNF